MLALLLAATFAVNEAEAETDVLGKYGFIPGQCEGSYVEFQKGSMEIVVDYKSTISVSLITTEGTCLDIYDKGLTSYAGLFCPLYADGYELSFKLTLIDAGSDLYTVYKCR